ncbi:MAG TPA: tRNA pseudouridine(38-40) synthase TruA [Candidatus Thermoplasmatota archaeon]|jgi:tRNA pseudouridine38-40 synthase|nr:tRNA pseudouridine(38-40) synthase TruA [Candidatus Thermoplasmatota archaeon]
MHRWAVRVAYDGRAFAGSQRQPDVRTVEGELLRGLAKIGAEPGRFQSASRTDKGVSALGNVVAFDTDFRPDALLPALGAATEDVWPHGLCPVPATFEARHARSRTYLYFLDAPDAEAADLEEALRLFVGTHDVRSFGRVEEGVSPIRTVLAIDVARAGGAFAIRVQGASFLWNQVRRMVEAARRVAEAEAKLDDIRRGLQGERVDLGTAPAENLILLDVDHGLAWQPNAAAREAALDQLSARLAGLERARRVLDALRQGIGAG